MTLTAASVERMLKRPPNNVTVDIITVTEGERDDYGDDTEDTANKRTFGKWAPAEYREGEGWQDATLDLYLPACPEVAGRQRVNIVTGRKAGLYEVVAVADWGVGQVAGIRRAT